jgi:hypothetical protein
MEHGHRLAGADAVRSCRRLIVTSVDNIPLATLDETGNVPIDQLGNAPGGDGGPSTLAGDSDVAVSGPASNQGLVYNGSKWVNAALVNSFQGRTGVVTLTKNDVTGTGLAPADFGAATTLRCLPRRPQRLQRRRPRAMHGMSTKMGPGFRSALRAIRLRTLPRPGRLG